MMAMKPVTDLDYVELYARKLRNDNSLFAQQRTLIESQLQGSASIFRSMFQGTDFRKKAREYLKATGVL